MPRGLAVVDPREVVRDTQTEEIYAALGKFVVHFEHLTMAMNRAIYGVMARHGGLKGQHLHDIVFAEHTAYPIASTLRSLLAEVLTLNSIEKKQLANLFRRINALIERRNECVHATWYIGWGADLDSDFSVAEGMKSKRGKSGGSWNTFTVNKKHFDQLSQEAIDLTNIVFRLHGVIVFDHVASVGSVLPKD